MITVIDLMTAFLIIVFMINRCVNNALVGIQLTTKKSRLYVAIIQVFLSRPEVL